MIQNVNQQLELELELYTVVALGGKRTRKYEYSRDGF